MRRIRFFFSMVLICGCAPQMASPVPVQGSVSLDGKPVADGAIYFISPGKVPEYLPIENGRFSGKVKPGQKRIEVAALRLVPMSPGEKDGAPLPVETKENYLPARYHSQSVLTVTILEADNPELKFALTSNP